QPPDDRRTRLPSRGRPRSALPFVPSSDAPVVSGNGAFVLSQTLLAGPYPNSSGKSKSNSVDQTCRAVVVLCELEGKTRRQAARQLGLPEGTVGSRLARAKTLLAKRLARHGLPLSGGALAAVLSETAAAGVLGWLGWHWQLAASG